MNLQELIDFHTIGAETCEAYAVTPGAAEDKNKDIGKHYNKRAKWHRDAIALVQGLQGQGEPVALRFVRLDGGLGGWHVATPRDISHAIEDVRIGRWKRIEFAYAEQPAPVVAQLNGAPKK